MFQILFSPKTLMKYTGEYQPDKGSPARGPLPGDPETDPATDESGKGEVNGWYDGITDRSLMNWKT
jgi:hypothetical protein